MSSCQKASSPQITFRITVWITNLLSNVAIANSSMTCFGISMMRFLAIDSSSCGFEAWKWHGPIPCSLSQARKGFSLRIGLTHILTNRTRVTEWHTFRRCPSYQYRSIYTLPLNSLCKLYRNSSFLKRISVEVVWTPLARNQFLMNAVSVSMILVLERYRSDGFEKGLRDRNCWTGKIIN